MSAHQIEADDLLTDAFTDARKWPTAPGAFRRGYHLTRARLAHRNQTVMPTIYVGGETE
jgi:hypothetical protein